ncbi:aminopeptidase N [Lichenihabitans psoromatis]|uniref:aminopeptidase N n=1 Tax=Lichenihabitans psoromatis TaxID=2528642 RepID=UPI0010384372|nr:aminopeptidase N [Lichenihabitans psoromatis]
MRADQDQPIRLVDYRPSDYVIDTIDLDIILHPTATRVTSRLSIRPNPKGRANAPLVLDGDGLVPVAVTLDDAALDLSTGFATADRLTIETPPQRPFVLIVETRLDPTANTKLMGLYRSGSAYCTQCEAEGFRRITYALDRPDVLSVFTTRIEAARAEASVLLGNGNLVRQGAVEAAEGEDRHFAVWHDPHPKPPYLFAVVGGNLGSIHDSFSTSEGRVVSLGIYVEPGKEPLAAYAMDALKRSMRWDETAFGRAYDLDVFNIVAVSDFNMGAMENKGLNVFNDKYILASPETATDADYAGIETVVAHEYFHNWTGNRITCRDWFQLCLKEGLTVFRDQEFSADQRSRAVKRIADVRTLRARQFPEDGGPLAHSVRPVVYREINNFYTATIYEKGAEIIRMLQLLIGSDAFATGMTLYFDQYDGTAATIEQFIGCFAETSGRDLTQFMRWYEQAGTPVVTATHGYDASAKTLTLDIAQRTPETPGQSEKSPLVMPLALGLVGAEGDAIPLDAVRSDDLTEAERAAGTIELTTAERRIVLHDVPGPVSPSWLRGFSAPVRLISSLTEQDRLTLLAHDSDGFNRWEAAQTLVSHYILDGLTSDEAPDEERLAALLSAFSAVLNGALVDPAFTAQVLNLPSEADLARDVGRDVDPDAIHRRREELRGDIGQTLRTPLLDLYDTLSKPVAYSPDASSAGRRALRNVVLGYLAAGDPMDGARLCAAQFDTADNMTDRMAALGIMTLIPGSKQDGLLARFYAMFERDALVVDKWLAVHAVSPDPTTLDRVRSLMRHPAFSLSNPNRVYSLIGSFASNPTQFNRADGRGYDLVAEVVLAVDAINPQVAARVLNAFRSWRMMESGRRDRAEAALRWIAARNTLSADVRDIVDRSLA